MGFEGRFPGFLSGETDESESTGSRGNKPTEVQVVGPIQGDCRDIVHEVTHFLNNNRYPEAGATCVDPSHDANVWIRDADATILLFLSTSRTSRDSALRVLQPLIEVIECLRTQYDRDGSETLMVVEGMSESTFDSIFAKTNVTRSCLSGASEYYLETGEIDKMKQISLAHCTQCRV